MEAKITVDGRKARLVLVSHQLMNAKNYKLGIAVCTRGIWTTLRALLDMKAEPNLTKGELFMVAWSPLIIKSERKPPAFGI